MEWGEIDDWLWMIKLLKDERAKHLVVGHSPAVAIDGPDAGDGGAREHS